MIIEEEKALGASIMFFPKGRLDAGNVACSETHMPDPEDPGWVDFRSVKTWQYSRQNKKTVEIMDSSIGKVMRRRRLQLGGDLEYKFTTNVLVGFIIGLFFHSAQPLDGTSFQFNPDAGIDPEGWLIIDNRDQDGTLILAANLWGQLEYTGEFKGGDGTQIEPEITFYQFKNADNTLAIGSEV